MNYRVRVTNDFRSTAGAATRSRAGITVNNGEGYTGPLTSEQLKELQDDQYLTITKEDGSALSKNDESLPAVPTSTEYEVAQAAEEAPKNQDELVKEVKKGIGDQPTVPAKTPKK